MEDLEEMNNNRRKDLEEMNNADIQMLENMARGNGHLEKLVASIDPNIKGMSIEKEAVLLSLVGGVERDRGNDPEKSRGDINILLCEDPRTRNNQLVVAAENIAVSSGIARGRTSGQDIPSAAISADRGLLLIDEFDRIRPMGHKILYRIMKYETVPISKEPFVECLPTRCAVICATSPIKDKRNSVQPPYKKVGMFPDLFLGFHLFFGIHDLPDGDNDRIKNSKEKCVDNYKLDLTGKLIWQARQRTPIIKKNIEKHMKESFKILRKESFQLRCIFALRRISEAYAKIRGSDSVEIEDIDRATHMISKYGCSRNQL